MWTCHMLLCNMQFIYERESNILMWTPNREENGLHDMSSWQETPYSCLLKHLLRNHPD